MTADQVLKELRAHGDEKVRARYMRDGAGENCFGVLMGKIRALLPEYTDDAVALGEKLGPAEVAQWRSLQRRKRSYAEEVLGRIERGAGDGRVRGARLRARAARLSASRSTFA